MNRFDANAVLQRLGHGLSPDSAGVARLLERISQAEEPELLRALLTERGALALLATIRQDARNEGRTGCEASSPFPTAPPGAGAA